MLILITGIPGTGKTRITKEIHRKNTKYKFIVVNDKDFCEFNELGSYNSDKEYEVDIVKLNKFLRSFLKENKRKNYIFEGHLWAELSKVILRKFDFIFVLKLSKTQLRKRLIDRKYLPAKIEENLFCQTIDYIPDLLKSKSINFNIINVTSDVHSNLNKINKFIKL